MQTQLVDACAKLGAVHCAVLQIRQGLSATQLNTDCFNAAEISRD